MRSGLNQDSIRTVSRPPFGSDKSDGIPGPLQSAFGQAAVLFVLRKFLSAIFLSPLCSLDKVVFISGD